MASNIKWLTVVLYVDESRLVSKSAYTFLPDKLAESIGTVLSNDAVGVSCAYLSDTSGVRQVTQVLRDTALDYHLYAVDVRGERCREENCEHHPKPDISSFYDNRRRDEKVQWLN